MFISRLIPTLPQLLNPFVVHTYCCADAFERKCELTKLSVNETSLRIIVIRMSDSLAGPYAPQFPEYPTSVWRSTVGTPFPNSNRN